MAMNKRSKRGSLTGARESERGFAILEVLIAAVVLGIALVGLALMYANGHGLVVGQGDERVALQLAQQKIEQQINAFRFTSLNPEDINQVCFQPGCTLGSQNETGLSAGYGASSSGTTTFSRFTCIQWVNKDTLQDTADGDPANDCPCTGGNNGGVGPLSLTKRICVKVTPNDRRFNVVVVKAILAGTP